MLFGVASSIGLFGLLAYSAGASSHLRSSVTSAGKSFFYDYSHHGTDWLQGICSDDERQSPVNFDLYLLDTKPNGNMSYSYQTVKSSFELANNGNTLSADYAGLGYGGIMYEDNWYNLMNVNFHSLSEHTFNGVHYPLEMHFVHKKWDSDDMIIVAVPITQKNNTIPGALIQEQAHRFDPDALSAAKYSKHRPPNQGDEFWNSQLHHFMKAALPLINQKSIAVVNEMDPLDLNQFLEGGIYLEYAGSLTSPPCATNVMWFVRRNPILASDKQVQLMSDSLFQMSADFGNYRKTMPLNGRPIATRMGVESQAPPQQTERGMPIAALPRAGREFKAMRYAKDALKLSKVASDYLYNMDTRMQKAARAHVDALAPDMGVAPATPAPGVAPRQMSSVDMTKTAAIMAKAIAQAAKDAIHTASEQIAKEAEKAAGVAAKEAVMEAGKQIVIPTAEPPPGAPGGPPGAAPGPAPGAAPAPAASKPAPAAKDKGKGKGKGEDKGKGKGKGF